MSLEHRKFDWMVQRLSQLRGQAPAPRVFRLEMSRILAEIHRDPFDPDLDVRNLRRRCRLKDNNVSSRFRFAVGVTMREYIEEIRLQAARRLIDESRISVFEISLAVGYKHPQTFHSAFLRRFRHTPASRR